MSSDEVHARAARRARLELVVALVFAGLTLLAIVVPVWIENHGALARRWHGELELWLAVPFGLVSLGAWARFPGVPTRRRPIGARRPAALDQSASVQPRPPRGPVPGAEVHPAAGRTGVDHFEVGGLRATGKAGRRGSRWLRDRDSATRPGERGDEQDGIAGSVDRKHLHVAGVAGGGVRPAS